MLILWSPKCSFSLNLNFRYLHGDLSVSSLFSVYVKLRADHKSESAKQIILISLTVVWLFSFSALWKNARDIQPGWMTAVGVNFF